MAMQDSEAAIKHLGARATLDNTNLKRIEQNPFILRDGSLPPSTSRMTRSHLNVLETKPKRKKSKKNLNSPRLRHVNSKKGRANKGDKMSSDDAVITPIPEHIDKTMRSFIDEELDELEAKMDAQFASLLRVYATLRKGEIQQS